MDWCGLRPARRGGVRLEADSTFHPTTKVRLVNRDFWKKDEKNFIC